MEHNPLASPRRDFLSIVPSSRQTSLASCQRISRSAGDSVPLAAHCSGSRVIANRIRGFIPPAEQHDHWDSGLVPRALIPLWPIAYFNLDEPGFLEPFVNLFNFLR